MTSELLHKELTALKRERTAYQAQNRLFENLIEMARSASKQELLKQTMQKTLEVAAELTGARKGSLFLINEDGVVTDSILTRGEITSESRSKLIGSVLDRGLAGWVREHLKTGLIEDSKTDARWLSLPDEPYKVRSALAVPILRHDALFGILTLMHPQPGHFTQESVEMVRVTADQMALAIENAQLYMKLNASYRSLEKAKQAIETYSNALNTELEKGRKIQRDFLPHQMPRVRNCEVAAYFQPAMQLSGDFYDVFPLPGDRMGLVIADVSDKGVGSALFMALLRSLVRIFSGHSKLCDFNGDRCEENETTGNPFSRIVASHPISALNAVSLTNEYIAREHAEEGMFATMFFGIIDPVNGILSYINGGHEPLIVLGEAGIQHRLQPTGPAVGMMLGTEYHIEEIQLEPGNILFGVTDGVTEARSPGDELYTRKRLESSIVRHPLSTARAFLKYVKSDLFQFIEEAQQGDDITMLAVRWGGCGSAARPSSGPTGNYQ